MAWTERQQAMLGAMGLRVWAPEGVATTLAVTGRGPQAEAAEAPASRRVTTSLPSAVQHATGLPPAPTPTAATPPRRAAGVAAAPQPLVAAPRAAPLQRPGIAELGWDALRADVAGCRACSLCESRTQTVFGVGHRQAHWMVVGEAPGEQEDRVGEPFVGAAGQLLDRMLAALQLTRAEEGPQPPAQRVYIVNTLKCRPPRNRNPAPEEMAQCEPYLVRQIELLKPRIILAMGAFAVKALLRTDAPVGKLRGRAHSYQGVPLVVTYHPAYLLRSLQEKAKAWDDLCLAAQVAEGAG